MEKIKIIKLPGEDLIAEILGETKTHITIKNPLRIVVIPNKTDPHNPNVGFAPFCEWTSDKELEFSKHLVLFVAEPLDVFTKQYRAQFSGLIMPETQIIT